MALTDENSGGFVATMPMAPAYGGGYGGGFGNGMGGDGWWGLLLLLAAFALAKRLGSRLIRFVRRRILKRDGCEIEA